MATHSISELATLTDEELVEIYDAKAKYTYVGTRFYLEELARRAQNRQTEQMLKYTKSVTRMTWVMTAATIINLIAAIFATYFGYKAAFPESKKSEISVEKVQEPPVTPGAK